jgi:hypothetical protein
VAHWIKLTYDRSTYVVDLEQVSAFCVSPNGRISFTVFDGNVTVVVNQQSDPDTYDQLYKYIGNLVNSTAMD